MDSHKIWIEQCQAARSIRQRFGIKSACDYLIAEKLVHFAAAAKSHREFLEELPRFQASVSTIFEPFEISTYLASLPRTQRSEVRAALAA